MNVGTLNVVLGLDSHLASELARERARLRTFAATADTRVNIRVDVDSNAASRALRALNSDLRQIQQSSTHLRDALRFLNFPILAIGATSFGYALAGAASGAYALVSALAPATGLIASLPGLLGAAAQAAGTVGLAWFGVSDAIKAMGDVQSRAATDAVRGAGQQEAAVRSLRVAREAQAEAERSAARQLEAADRAVASAKRGLTDAQEDALRAQEDLTQARADATRELEDMRASAEGMALSEERAALQLEQARSRLVQVNRDSMSTELERRDAMLDVREAEYRLGEAQRDRTRHATDLRAAEQAGVDGSPQVVAARDRIADADARVLEAQESVRLAEIERTRTIEDSARTIAEASARVAEAMTTSGDVGTASMQKLQRATADLSPATLAFAQQVHGLRDEFNELRASAGEELFPDLSVALNTLLALLPLVNDYVGQTADVIGDLAIEGANMVTSGPWTADFGLLASRNVEYIRHAGDVTFNLADALRNIMVAAIPMTDWLVNTIERWSEWIAAQAEARRESGEMTAYFERTTLVLDQLFRIIGNVVEALLNIGGVADEFGGRMLTNIEDVTARWAEWSGTVEGQTAIREWFEDVSEVAGVVWDKLRGMFYFWRDEVAPIITTYILPNLEMIAAGFFGVKAAMGLVNAVAWATTVGTALWGLATNPVFLAIGASVGLIYLAFSGEGQKILDWITNSGPEAAARWGEWAGIAVAWVIRAAQEILPELDTYLQGILDWALNEGIPAIALMFTNFTNEFWKWVAPSLEPRDQALDDWLESLLVWMTNEALPQIIAKLTEWGAEFVAWIVPRIPEMLDNLVIFLTAITVWIVTDGIPIFTNAMFDMGAAAIDGLWRGLQATDIVKNLGDFVSTAVNRAIDYFNLFLAAVERFGASIGLTLNLGQISPLGGGMGNAGAGSFGATAGKRSGFATGGPVGPGMDYTNSDSVPAYLTRGEWVMPTASVRKYGPATMKAIQKGDFPAYRLGGDVQGLNPEFAKKLNAWSEAMGQTLMITSGFRTRAEQEAVYARYLRGGPQAAKPGTSRHETGIAADVQGIFRRGFAGGNRASEFGLHFPVKSENWHVEALGMIGQAVHEISTFFRELWDQGIGAVADPMRAQVASLAGAGAPGIIAAAVGSRLIDTVLGYGAGKADAADRDAMAKGISTGGVGKGVEQWRGIVNQALRMLGLAPNLADTTLRRMHQESGGNARAINNWDSNARKGTPSKGLMQVIDPTFRAHAHPGYNRDIWDPMSNVLASMRYALSRYGSLPAAYNRPGGYDRGGLLNPGWNVSYNGTPESEVVAAKGNIRAEVEQALAGRATTIHVDARSDPRAVPIARAIAWRMKTAGV